MTHMEVLKGLKEPPCSPEYCDGITIPFGKYQGVRVAELYDVDKEFFRQFRYSWLNKQADPDSVFFDHNLNLAYALWFIWNERFYADKYEQEVESWRKKTLTTVLV